ncbi:GNAT family N-acetyltransferase [Cohnella sp. CFH 77786]|uniref:GNAT family N-acetyltransferase n=1 Tax=Cohnella sp. CFH 77786 TaxID=2662265 RepID=UPI001C60FB13|nr:GNAT family protein [Cohnella sp. CFH 77786]MBW5449454.1 GNAT family N-acetyltransferase [Cohnella sp. CFH 77786]
MTSKKLISSSMIHFRRTTEDDIDFITSTEQDPESREYIFTWTRDKHIQTINSEDHLHITIENNEKRKIGYIILAGILNQNSCIELVRINIGEKGKGYGKESVKLIQDFVFNVLEAHRLWLDVKEHNDRAKHVYESAGFKIEGILRECIKKDDIYESLIIMGILKNEYHR